jgi:hypothetical protein
MGSRRATRETTDGVAADGRSAAARAGKIGRTACRSRDVTHGTCGNSRAHHAPMHYAVRPLGPLLRFAFFVIVLLGGGAVAFADVPSPATPATSATCRRLEAEARSTAALLHAPELELQGLRLPAGGDVEDPGAGLGRELQARAALSMSPVDVWRGRHVVAAAEADCRRTLAADRIAELLRHGTVYGRAAALGAQVAFLDERLAVADALITEAEARLERRLTTAADVESLRGRRLRLFRKRSAARQELAVLQAERADQPAAPILAELARYEGAVIAMEDRRSRLRSLSAWDVDVRGGAAAGEEGGEWFGVVTFTYDLGQPWQRGAERRFLAARKDELRTADRELRGQLDRFRAGMKASVVELREELRLVEAELDGVTRRIDVLRRAESTSAHDQIAAAELERLDLESDSVFLRRLLSEREAVTK